MEPGEVVKDNRCRAIIFMNLFAIGGVGQAIVFKLAIAEGATVIDYQLFRSLGILIAAAIELCCTRRSPITEFPTSDKYTLLLRCIMGSLVILLFNICLSLIPLTTLMIIFQSSSFWISLLAFCMFREPLYLVEMLGMVVCFAGMVTITLSEAKGSSGSTSELGDTTGIEEED